MAISLLSHLTSPSAAVVGGVLTTGHTLLRAAAVRWPSQVGNLRIIHGDLAEKGVDRDQPAVPVRALPRP